MKWYLKVLKDYFQFKGRASRKEYWMFILFNAIFAMIAMGLDNVLGLTFGNLPYGVIYSIYCLAIIIPSFAVLIRRLHDIDKSGWMCLISLIPLIGGIWLFVLMCMKGNPLANQYGAPPTDC